ncbi:LysE family translocator [Mesorhizobium sp. M3A.F.Ca.ET.201.01.1.1]|uniref:LysE family translocator n=1 Tax=Mesorhizobium sp. M3A.F.Ca.ET.201.01.1.1 TaxID=2563946 RepID=UPI0010938952|nr:LysE family translocator [Mesorhizobium sp. M3A.F.Ca.ET.201.01.1.1]TGS72231.1 LysE family translocator [Mesorhizobium sp. M3A.F.Ca.ET.201.01.1.1]
MLPLDTIVAFAAAATLLAFVPGPDNLFVLIQSALYGRMVGVFVTLGLCTGLIVHTVAVAIGVAAIFQTSQAAFDALKIIGAAYLIYLAYKAFRARPEALASAAGKAKPMRQMYLRGIVMNVTNPKVAIFFLAFLPQFTHPERGSIVAQMLLLGAIFTLCAFLSFTLISMLAGTLSRWLRQSDRGQLWLNKIAGLVFVGLALKLATSHR